RSGPRAGLRGLGRVAELGELREQRGEAALLGIEEPPLILNRRRAPGAADVHLVRRDQTRVCLRWLSGDGRRRRRSRLRAATLDVLPQGGDQLGPLEVIRSTRRHW